MADEKISALPSAGALAGTEPLPIVQGGVTVKTTVQDVADLAGNTSITPITAAALLALEGASNLSTTTIYVVTDAPLRIAIQAETNTDLTLTGTIVQGGYSGTVFYELSTNTFKNGTIYDGDGNIWNGTLPSDTTFGSDCIKNTFNQGAINNVLGNDSQWNTFEQNSNGNTLGINNINNTFKQNTSGFTFGNDLISTTIEADIVGDDYTASPAYDFLYNNAYDSVIFQSGGVNYHRYYDVANDRIVITDLATPANVTYIGGATPDLQQVTTAGATTSVGITVDNGAGESIDIKHDLININNALGANATISSPTLATTTNFEIPNKLGGTETFAMLSDITSLVASVSAGTNISVTGTATNPIINSLADRYKTSSVTSNTIGNGSKTFTVDANLAYIPLQEVLIVNSPSNHMHGEVTSYNSTTGQLVVDVNHHTGSGTFASWVINLDGIPIDAITGVGTANEIAYFTSGQVITSLAVATYPSLTELAHVKGLGSQAVGTTDTNTLTNKRITARTGTVASDATPTINTDNVDFFSITAQTVAITSFSTNLTGTPTEGQTLWIAITGTAARAITWGASFEASTIALPTTTVTTARLDVAFIWNSVTSKWRCVGTC